MVLDAGELSVRLTYLITSKVLERIKKKIQIFVFLQEFDEPTRLLSNPAGLFRSLVEHAGAASEFLDMTKKVMPNF